MDPIASTSKYHVFVQGWGKWKGKDEWVTYFEFIGDYKSKKLKLISDKISLR